METDESTVKEDVTNKLNKEISESSPRYQSEEQRDIFIVIPPDGGWGWIVVTAAFFSFLISDGMIYTFGIFLINMSEAFDCSTSKVALTGAIMAGFFCITGPFIAALVNQFGCRKIAISGGILASLSCILTSVSSSLHLTYLTHGIIGGIGFGMIYITAVIAVGFYFERWRALATGISVCGAGIGGIALPPLLSLLLESKGWRYTFRIMAAVTFACAFWGILYKPLEPIKIESIATVSEKSKSKKKFFHRFHNTSHPTISHIISKHAYNEIPSSLQLIHNLTSSTTKTFDDDSFNECYPTNVSRKSLLKSSDFQSKTCPTSSDEQVTSTVTIYHPKLPRNISSEFIMSGMASTSSRSSFRSARMNKLESTIENVINPIKIGDSRLSTVYEEGKSSGCWETLCDRLPKCNNCEVCWNKTINFCCHIFDRNNVKNNITRPLYRDDIFYSASLMFLPEYRKSMYISQSKVVTPTTTSVQKSKSSMEYSMLVTRTITQKEINENKTCTLCSESIKRTIATMLDFSLLKSPSFLLLIFNAIFTSLGFYTPYMFIKDRAIQNGIPKHLAFWLISGIGVTNTLGRITCGIISSFPQVHTLTMSYVSLFIGGMATLFSGVSFNIWVQFGYAGVYGISVACMSALRTIILVELLGLEKLTNAIGIMLMFQGVASLAGTSISGFLRDITGDYHTSFYFAGGCITIGSILLVPIRKVSEWEKKRKQLKDLNPKYSDVQTM